MKKRILLLSTLLGLASLTYAQKLALIEEFSGENCGPCAAYNPAFMNLVNAAGNSTKVLLLKYQSPIPTPRPIYNINTVFTDARMSYYSVNSAPSFYLNGASKGNITSATQAMFNAAAAETTPFTMSVANPVYNANGQTMSVTVTVTATSAVTVSNVKLRAAFAEELNYTTPPGTNGETHFQNVVRQMYPNAAGTTLDAAWTAGQSRTHTVTGVIPGYVNPAAPSRFFAAFLQKDDATKEVLQSAKTGNVTIQLPAANAALTSINMNVAASNMVCTLPYTLNATTKLKNTGTEALTTAKIYYKLGTASAWTEMNWTGNLAAGQSVDVALSGLNITSSGIIQLLDSVGLPNGKVDLDDYDNANAGYYFQINSNAVALPVENDFETDKADWMMYFNGSNGYPMQRVNNGSGASVGYNSATALYFNAPNIGPGPVGYFLLPKATLPAGAKALDFYQSYAMRTGANGDRLEVVYSSDCGATWTRVWMLEGQGLATTTPTSNTQGHLPTTATYVMRSVDMTAVPDGALVAFRATSGGGNFMWIDNVKFRTGAPVAIEDLMDQSKLSVFPNPVSNKLNVSMSMKRNDKVTFAVVNTLGQEVYSVTKDVNSGNQVIDIDASQLAAGMYILNIKTAEGAVQQKFTKM